MKITVTFDSMKEFLQYVDVRGKVCTTFTDFSPTEIKTLMDMREVAQEPAGAPEAPEPEKKPKEQEKPAEKPQEPEKAPDLPFTEDKKVTVEEVRKILADLNKAAGKNVAKDLIKAVGFKRLTEVTEGALPALKNMAEEEARKYA